PAHRPPRAPGFQGPGGAACETDEPRRARRRGMVVTAVGRGTPGSIAASPMRSGARFFIAIALAVVLGGWLAYVSLGGTLEKFASPSQLTADGSAYRLNGLVGAGAPADAAGLAEGPSGLRLQAQAKKKPRQAGTVP